MGNWYDKAVLDCQHRRASIKNSLIDTLCDQLKLHGIITNFDIINYTERSLTLGLGRYRFTINASSYTDLYSYRVEWVCSKCRKRYYSKTNYSKITACMIESVVSKALQHKCRWWPLNILEGLFGYGTDYDPR